jgi:hypothetical protein
VSGPTSIVIEATGIITDFNDQGVLLMATPNGVNFTSKFGDVLPLQEARGIPPNTPTAILNALMGAFVPAAKAMSPTFVPEDAAKLGPGQVGITASSLFFIGAGPFTFNAAGAGTLYLGINDSFVADNGGGYSVTLNAIPEPGNERLTIVGLSAVAWAWRRRYRKSQIR